MIKPALPSLWWLLISGVFLMSSCSHTPTWPESKQYAEGKFINLDGIEAKDNGKLWSILKRYMFEKRTDATPVQPVPVQMLTRQQLLEDCQSDRLYRLGHSTLLLCLEGEFWMTDPMFSDRASPVQWMGPKRFHQSPIALEDLPPIRGVIISHNHYDHLDEATIKALNSKVQDFYVPLGVGQSMQKWGVPSERIHERDWWQSSRVGNITLTATPAQHFSGRSLFDGDETLWASWVIETPNNKIFFSGDSGYFKGFKQIGDRFGPFDLTLIETGAYDRDWAGVHMRPEQSLQAHIDLRGRVLMPIHNSTFDLALHPWYEPMERLNALAKQHQQVLTVPRMGQALPLGDHLPTQSSEDFWWRMDGSDAPANTLAQQQVLQ